MQDAYVGAPPQIKVKPLELNASFRSQAYAALKQAITSMEIYDHPGDIRLDERQLSQDLGISRTPIREAMMVLEQEGFVRTLPRRGIYVVRKTKAEIVDMILVWAALESMAARLVTQRASDEDIRSLRGLFDEFQSENPDEHLSEYSEANIRFHQALIRLSGCPLITDITENLFLHMRAIRRMTIGQQHRAQRSLVDHMRIIEALERRNTELAERLVREHTLDLAAHVEKHGTFPD